MASYEHGLEFDAYLAGKKEEQERILAWLKKQTLSSQYQDMKWVDACLLLHKNFEQQIKGENS
jgi:hypothetical protein